MRRLRWGPVALAAVAVVAAGCSTSTREPARGTVMSAPPVPAQAPSAAAPAPSSAPVPAPAPTPAAAYTSNADLEAALSQLAARAPSMQLVRFGQATSGAPLLALRIGLPPGGAPRPVVVLLAQQHGNEPSGAEALLALARDIASGAHAEALRRIDLVLVPRLNPDGALTARRENASGIDLDADHLLLRSPEARAFAQLVRDVDPAVIVDLREYDASPAAWQTLGAVPAANILLRYAATPELPQFLTRAAEDWFRKPLSMALENDGIAWEWFFAPGPDAAPGRTFTLGSLRPDNELNVSALRNSVSLQFSARAAAPTAEDVRTRMRALVRGAGSVLESAALHADDLGKLRRYVRDEVARQACHGDVVLDAAPTHGMHTLATMDARSGARSSTTVEWEVLSELQLRSVRPRPCGYWLGAGAGEAVERLRRLGVQLRPLNASSEALGSFYREQPGANGAPRIAMVNALVEMPAGGTYVTLSQPLGNLVVAALEPGTPYGYHAAGLIPRLADVARLRRPPPTPASEVMEEKDDAPEGAASSPSR